MHATAFHPTRLNALPIAVAAALVASPLAAQQTPREAAKREAAMLDTIEVIAERPRPDVRDRVERAQALGSRDLFGADARLAVGGAVRVGQRLYVRGVEASNLAVTLDGARIGQNLHNHRGGLPNLDPEILKRVEVAPGPVAADAGYGALGGTVRMTTIDAQDRLAEGERFGARVRASTASAADARRLSATGYARLGSSLGVLVHTAAQEFDDLRTGGGVRIPFSAGEDRSMLAKLSLLDVGPHELRVGVERHRSEGLNFLQRADFPWQLQPATTVRPPQLQELTRTTQTAGYRYRSGDLFEIALQAASAREDFFAPNNRGERGINETRNIDLRNTARFGFWGADAEWVAGVELFRQRGTSEQLVAPRFFAIEHRNTGAFSQLRVGGDSWDIGLGARNDRFEGDYGSRSSEGRETSLNASGQWRFGGGWRVQGGYGEAVRGFGTIPLQFIRNIAPVLTFNGRADGELRPERGRQSEIGMGWVGENVLGARQVEVGLKRYLTRLQDVILFSQPGTGPQGQRPIRGFFNATPSVRFEGAELVARWSSERMNTTLTAVDAETRNLALQPQFLARVGAPLQGRLVWDTRYALDEAWTLGYTLTAVQGIDRVPPGQTLFIPRGGYAVHDLQLAWRSLGEREWGIGLAINNVFDRRYSSLTTFTEGGFATDEAGRDVRLTLDAAF